MERHSSTIDVRSGMVAGAGAYLFGLLIVISSHRLGIHPESGLWLRDFTLGEYVVVHAGAQLPVWSVTLQTAVLGHTAILLAVLVGAGYLVASRSPGAESIQSGSSIVLGYFFATTAAMGYALFAVEAVTWLDLLAPLALVGVVVPAVFGGIGGWLREWVTAEN